MKTTRRDFIKRSLVAGGTLLVPPAALKCTASQPEGRLPAYARLEQEGKLAERIERAFDILRARRFIFAGHERKTELVADPHF